MTSTKETGLGAQYLGQETTTFRVWAPYATTIEVHSDGEQLIPLTPTDHGYFTGTIKGLVPGDRYRYRLDHGDEYPDPASRWQPDGVQGPSAIFDPQSFVWHDSAWRGHPWENLVFYEVHVGTFSDTGRFEGIIEDLPRLSKLGITAIEIMPIAAFPGERNWGYDGVFPFAPQESYGGPEGFMRLVDACHLHNMSVFLDVVYNHTGPEGSVLSHFGPYFNTHYHTPWGQALNFDGPESDPVREFFLENVRQWIRDYHVDGLRLDAVHAIIDSSAEPFLRELTREVDALASHTGRPIYTVAESDRNDPREIMPRSKEGFGFSGHWNDDLHHALHAFITGERTAYYVDYGPLDALAQALAQGYVYTGQYSSYRQRRHGRPYRPHALGHLVVYGQNHDQVGNRPLGDRLTTHLSENQLRLMAATILLSAELPLIFMGEEYGELAPFPYFVDHQDPKLLEAVREGRAREWAFLEEALPDPADPLTFLSARLSSQRNNSISAWYGTLLRFRQEYLAKTLLGHPEVTASVWTPDAMIFLSHQLARATLHIWLNFSPNPLAYSREPKEVVLLNSATPDRVATPLSPLVTPLEVPAHGCLVTYLA